MTNVNICLASKQAEWASFFHHRSGC